jgi:hypothetical protein
MNFVYRMCMLHSPPIILIIHMIFGEGQKNNIKNENKYLMKNSRAVPKYCSMLLENQRLRSSDKKGWRLVS